jgi:hypothetical protein
MMITLQYLAGLVDGEGCIWFTRDKPAPKVNIGMDISASILIEAIHAEYGGTLCRSTRKQGHITITVQWGSLSDVEKFLIKIEPYLILKREQARLALWWIANKQVHIPFKALITNKEFKLMKKNPLRTLEQAVANIRTYDDDENSLNVVSIEDRIRGV